MSEEERRRCCILGGCGCGAQAQLTALAEEIELAGSPHKAAAALLEIFGRGPHRDRLQELGLDEPHDEAEGG